MDWGIDPARVAEISQVASSRRFSARDTEKFILAITGGGSENADMPLWDMLQVLFALGALTAGRGMGPRDAAIACMLDETGMLLRPLRQERPVAVTLAGVAVESSATELTLAMGPGKTRTFSWNRIRRGLGLADFLFAAEAPGKTESGLVALRGALDIVFSDSDFGDDCLKRAVQEPARFMRAWRRQHLPLLAFADMIRQREAYLHEQGRRDRGREFDPDDLMSFWSFALQNGETWSFARFAERFCALLREERAGVGRRDMLAPVAIETLMGNQPSENPEEALIAWLDHQAALGDDDEIDIGEDDEPPEDEDEQDEDGLRERVSLALSRLPAEPKFLNKEEREAVGRALALLPIAHEQPLTLVRSRAVAPWENRLVEATRRAVGSLRGDVDQSMEPFDYPGIGEGLAALCRRFDELLLIGWALGAIKGTANDAVAAEGPKLLKRWRHDRASFRMEDAKLALIFARHESGLRTVAGALHRIVRQQRRLRETTDLAAQAERDASRFGAVFAVRYLGRMKRQ
ncbi:hypothetical protein [Bosea sp. PAMC 26642]|uniref:hypothetical protein n=1 Tax=Bosea sp. (strain PAMC 26642) TaxID=1792307 RepID=UPI0007704253|nr:hypothetical protein [Bosea sp. PAMC 26642]AMJ61793.1 hypothetical protein AXW83_17090 [Bosea sp. PAMC 26642]